MFKGAQGFEHWPFGRCLEDLKVAVVSKSLTLVEVGAVTSLVLELRRCVLEAQNVKETDS